MPIEFRPNPAAPAEMKAKILEQVQMIMELDVKPEAVRTSPVTPEGLQLNLEKGKKGQLATGTGFNRQSIDVSVEMTPEGPKAELFTQSGYGGYLETGTAKMRAQPYLWPALMKYISKLKGTK